MRKSFVALLLAAVFWHPRQVPPAAADQAPPSPASVTHGGHPAHGMQHRFEHAEDWVRVFDDPARDAWQRPAEVVRLLALSPGMTVVDLGAGTGYFVHHLSPAVGAQGRVLALDVEPDMIRYLKERVAGERLGNVEARVVQPDDPGLPDGSVDRILVVDTWHHIGDRARYGKKLAAALKPDGFVMIVDFTKESKSGPPPEMRLGPEQVAADLAGGGLGAAAVEESLPEQYVVIGRKPP
ncbi:MAG: methyltransferase domain-containing protein [Deltaproteobacteria bacterium]|nr:methyltransferase domain-containing protein [Deltaproteobacteria bacterium]